jgi:hypothetical protein
MSKCFKIIDSLHLIKRGYSYNNNKVIIVLELLVKDSHYILIPIDGDKQVRKGSGSALFITLA